ncbi:hypothetical protein DW322_09810 [Rhodococcus rhodnii]|nr:hypothetical protein [Rhodococcus rhodnii]TXG92566.1 hypothetical protein DW322_09810 [Rhodococcus rhodnii]
MNDAARRERIEQLRRQIAAVPAKGESVAAAQPIAAAEPGASVADPALRGGVSPASVLPVPGGLADLLPRGGLVRGSVATVSGAASLLVGLVAAVTADGGHVAVVGRPDMSLLAAVEMGARLDRLAVVPDPGPDPVEIAAVLLDGMDLVVLGLGGAAVPPTRARAVVARARSKRSTLVVTDGRWDGAEVALDARVDGYHGLGDSTGRGRVCGVRLSVNARGRAFPVRSTRLGVQSRRGRVEWECADTEAAAVVAERAVGS